MAACAVTSVEAKFPEFQALKEYYKSKGEHYSDDHLAQALQLYREYRELDSDFIPETPQQKGAFTRFLKEYLKHAQLSRTESDLTRERLQDIYSKLYSEYTPERLEQRVGMLARDFSEEVDRLQAEYEDNKTRQEIILSQADGKKNGFISIIERVFDRYEKAYTDVDARMALFDKRYPNATEAQREATRKRVQYQAEEYKKVLKNKGMLSALAATRVGETEGFVVRINNFQVDFETLSEQDEESTQDNTNVDNEEGSKGDRYTDFRTLKLLETLSVRARKLITRIPKVDSNGKIERDDLGVSQFLGGRNVAVVLKKVLVNSSPDSLMSDLEAAADFYPWIRGLINTLNENDEYKTTVYDNFKSAETTYLYVAYENGRYVPKIANSRSAGYALMREAGNNLRAGYTIEEKNSVYTGYGALSSEQKIKEIRERFSKIKDSVLADDGAKFIRMVDGDKPVNESRAQGIIDEAKANGKDAGYILSTGADSMDEYLKANPNLTEEIASHLRGIGFAVSAKDIETIAKQTMTKNGFRFVAGSRSRAESTSNRNKLCHLVEYIDQVYARAEEIYAKGQTQSGQYLFNTTGAFRSINSCIALAQYGDVEARVVNEGKALSAYNHVNLLHQTFDVLANKTNDSEEVYQENLNNQFLKYEGMSLGFGEERQIKGWLRMFRDNEGQFRDKVRIVDIAAFNHVEYERLTRPQKLTNSLIMYLDGGNTLGSEGYSLYEVPIQSDYSTAYNFISAPRLESDDVVDAIVDEVLIELERISSLEQRLKNDNRVKLNVYEEQGVRFQIFPEFNDNGFREKYTSIDEPGKARDFVREQVVAQLEKIIEKDVKTIEDAKVLTNPALQKVDFGNKNYDSLYDEEGLYENLSEDAQAKLREYFLNTFYARQQIIKLLVGGTEQFNGLIDFEKRNMLTHATRSSLYTKATWNGERVGRDSQNVVYMDDDQSSSKFIEDIKDMLHALLEDKVISQSQYDTMVSAYSKIKTTDGQGFRTLESYRRVMVMTDQWDDKHETAYRHIMKGRPSKSDIDVFMQNIKPVLTGYEEIQNEGENQKPVKLTVLHKYSEQVLLPLALAKTSLQARAVPLRALASAQEELQKKGKDIDLFLFSSCVKVGGHSIIQPFAKKDGVRLMSSESEIKDYIVNSVLGKDSVMHTFPYKYYGIAASTPAHAADDKIAWSSQAEKVAWANILKGQKFRLNGKPLMIEVDGKFKEADAWDAREIYFQIKTADIIDAYKKLRITFANSDELERVLQEELANKSYSSNEVKYALAHLKDGTFALPLYSPNVEHQVQQLFASIIKKRLTKPKKKGANILQATSLGMDAEASMFDNANALTEDEKLNIVFEGKGKDKRIKYVEVFIPIHDSRLKMFADKNGVISPERLRDLVAEGIIPESMLEFIAYRTPSDAEHSVIPCRIKGFIANTGGATIIMPKEIMVMTGHDYDGDKMRCHFKNFKLVDKSGDELELSDTDIVQMMLGQKAINKNWQRFEMYEYDYTKSALENSQYARDNARVDLMFNQLTSVDGSKRVLIPGGCDESKVIAKSMHIVRLSNSDEMKSKIGDALITQYKKDRYKKYCNTTQNPMSEEDFYKSIKDDISKYSDECRSAVKRSTSLYNFLIRKSDGHLTNVLRRVSSAETPYSVSHAADAFDYIMGGAEMISVYAVYNSALQMLQRVEGLNYVPRVSTKGKQYKVKLFGKEFGKLFELHNHKGRLASLGLARLLNAAVDNNKDPILGYLNQTKQMSEMTFLLLSAGITEEEVHLIMNQPSIVRLINRLKERDSQGLSTEAQAIIDEISEDNVALADISDSKMGQWNALEQISKMDRNDFTDVLSWDYEDVLQTEKLDVLKKQIAVLQLLIHLEPAASNLAKFVKSTRPESESGAIGSTLPEIIAKNIDLNDFREKIEKSTDSDLRISGMREIIAKRDVHEGWDESYIAEVVGKQLPEVVALNSLMNDTSLEMFMPFYPQAKPSWVELAKRIANLYSYKSIQEGTIKKITQEMILWKLLSNKKFAFGDTAEEQKRIIVDVPKQLKDIKDRINKAAVNPGNDKVADALVGNAFLSKLSTTSPENSTIAPRIMFTLNGAAVEGTSDLIRASWGAMLDSEDESVRQLAIDLFKYNIYTNGLAYGMYEFSHFAPFSVMSSTPGFIEALQDVLKSSWKDDDETENFFHQYCMNHWGDSKFLPKYAVSKLNVSARKLEDGTNVLLLSNKNGEDLIDSVSRHPYIILTSGEKNEVQTLYEVTLGDDENPIVLVKAEKLSNYNRSQQVTLHYDPSKKDYHDVKPVVPGNDSAWGQLDQLNTHNENNIDAPNNNPAAPGVKINKFAQRLGLKRVAKNLESLEEKAAPAVESNDKVEQSLPKRNMFMAGLGLTRISENAAPREEIPAPTAEDYQERVDENKLLNISHINDDGTITTDKVPATPKNIEEARRQKVFVKLNQRLREILRQKGVSVGVLTDAEARLAIGGVADFDTANVTAEGLLELIRVANGLRGELALPEEFAHVAIEMLGHNHPLVQRLLNAINESDEALHEALGNDYNAYVEAYGNDRNKLVLEAAGKIVSKALLREQELETKPLRKLMSRIVEAIKAFFRKFSMSDVQAAIFEANDISSALAKSLFGGKILDQMSVDNIDISGSFFDVKKDLTEKNDILTKILKNELKRLSIFKKRLEFAKKEESSPAIDATEAQIAKLESAIKNYKTEDAIISYMNDAVEFLKNTNDSLDETLKLNASGGGEKANIVCRKLNVVRDTLYSFSKVIEDVNRAIEDGEIQDSQILTDAIEKTSGVLTKFFNKYNSVAKLYFEEMLANVYGKEGLDLTVGKNKGRKITIKEMARRLDKDLGFMSRWFNAIADCNDYVLKAIDDITRQAKIRGRRRAEEIRMQVEVAVAKLKRETGSMNQDFMFEKDEKGNKTGKYISTEDAAKLSQPQKDYYKTMMEIKSQIDELMPPSLVDDRKIVMLRKSTVDKVKSAEGFGSKAVAYWDAFKNRFIDTSDNATSDYEYVDIDFEGNKVDRLPIKFMNKGKNESYNDMTDDVAMSIMTYSGMACEYSEMNGVINILENAKYMASQREVVQTAGSKEKVESRVTDSYEFTKPFTVSAARSRAQEALEDFFQMHVYGHIQKAEGNIGKTKISKRKVVDFLNALASYTQMGINIPQRIANVGVGFSQIIIETGAKGVFNAKDVAWASAMYAKMTGDRLADTGATDTDNKLSLWDIRFDVHQDNGRDVKKYGKGRFARIFNSSLLFAGLTAGEDYLANVTSLAAARNYKVLDENGKESNLWEAYEVKYTDPVNKVGAHLELKKGWSKPDGTPITFEDEQKFMKQVAGLNFELQGIYNLDDRSAIQQYAFGALMIMYRKWIAPSIKRRYGKSTYSVMHDRETEGYYRTLGRTLWQSLQDAKDAVTEQQSGAALFNIVNDIKAYYTAFQINKSKMTPYELSNLKRAWTDISLVAGLFLASALLMKLPPDDESGKKELSWFESMLLSQLLRVRMELGSQAPTPIFLSEAGKILQSPFAAIGPLKSALDAFNLLMPYNYMTTIKSGRYKGHTKAYKYFREFPLIAMYKKVENFVDPTPVLNYYKNDTVF